MLPFTYSDGGRTNSGIKAYPHDCIIRAISLATGRNYAAVHYDFETCIPNIRERGVNSHDPHFILLMQAMQFRSVTCTPALRLNEFRGHNAVLKLPGHATVVVNGSVHDMREIPPSTQILSYWVRSSLGLFNVIDSFGSKRNKNPLNFDQAKKLSDLLNLNYAVKSALSPYENICCK